MYCLEKLQRELAYFFDMDLRELPRVQDLLVAKGYTQVQKGDEIITLEPSAKVESSLATPKQKTIEKIDSYIKSDEFKALSKDKQEAILSLKTIEPSPMPQEVTQENLENLLKHFNSKQDRAQREFYAKLFNDTKENPHITLEVKRDNETRQEYIKAYQHKDTHDLYYIAITKDNDTIKVTGYPITKIKDVISQIKNAEKVVWRHQGDQTHTALDFKKSPNLESAENIIPQSTPEKPKWSRADSKKWKLAKLEQTKATAIELYKQLQPLYEQARSLLIQAKKTKPNAKAQQLKDKAWELIEQETKPFIKKLEQHDLELDRNAFILYPETASIKIKPKHNYDLKYKARVRGAQGLKGAAKYRAQALQRLSEKDYMTPFEQATKASNPLTSLHALKFELLKDLNKAKVYINQQGYDKDLHKTYLDYVNRASSELDSIEQSIKELKNAIVPKPLRVQEVRSKVQEHIKWRDEVRFDTDYLLALESDGVAHALEYLERQLATATLPQQASFITQLKEQIKEHFPTQPTPPSTPTPTTPKVDSSDITFTDKNGKEHTLTQEAQEQWLETFNLKSLDESYIPKLPPELADTLGKEIRLTKGSLYKIVEKGREQYIPQIKETLEKPDFALKDSDDILIIAKEIGDKQYFTSINLETNDYFISISNAPKKENILKNKVENGAKVVYQSPNAKSIFYTDTLLQEGKSPTNKIDSDIIPQMPKDNNEPEKILEYFKDDFMQGYIKARNMYEGHTPMIADVAYKALEPIETAQKRLEKEADESFREILQKAGYPKDVIQENFINRIHLHNDYGYHKLRSYFNMIEKDLHGYDEVQKPIAEKLLKQKDKVLDIYASRLQRYQELEKKRLLLSIFADRARDSSTKEKELLKKFIDDIEAKNTLESATQTSEIIFTDKKGKEHTLTQEAQEQWLKTFNLKSLDEAYTPKHSDEILQALGGKEIKLQLGSLKKLVAQGREQYIPQIKEVLDSPEAIMRDDIGEYLFIKHLKDDDYFVNVSFDNGEYLVSISNGIKETRNLNNKLEKGGEFIYQSPNFNSISQKLLQTSQYSANKIDNTIIPQQANTSNMLKTELKEVQDLKAQYTSLQEKHKTMKNKRSQESKALKEQIETLRGQWLNKKREAIDKQNNFFTEFAKHIVKDDKAEQIIKKETNESIQELEREIKKAKEQGYEQRYYQPELQSLEYYKKILTHPESYAKAKEMRMQELGNSIRLLKTISYTQDTKYTEAQKNKLRQKLELYFDIHPIQEFGTNYAEHYRDGVGAIEKLLNEKQGQVSGAFYRKELGDIDVVWGDDNFGLKHILDKHGSEFKDMAKELDEIIQNGEVVKRKGRDEAYNIEYKGFKVGINKGFNKQGENKWVVTAFNDNIEKTAKTAPANDSTKGASLPLNSSDIIPQSSSTLSAQAQEYARQILQGLRQIAQTPLNKLADEVYSTNRRFMLREARYIKQQAQELADSFANLRWQDLRSAIRYAKVPYDEAMFKELRESIESKEFAKFIESSYPKPTQKSLFDEVDSSTTPQKTTPYTTTQAHTHQIPTDIAQKWLKTFGLKDLQEPYTPKFSDEVSKALEPILQGEQIKLTSGSLLKLMQRDRLEFLPYIKESLETPQVVVKQVDGALIFAKDFRDEKLGKFFTSVSKNDNGEWIISSNAPKNLNNLQNKIKEGGEVLYSDLPELPIIAKPELPAKALNSEANLSDIIPQVPQGLTLPAGVKTRVNNLMTKINDLYNGASNLRHDKLQAQIKSIKDPQVLRAFLQRLDETYTEPKGFIKLTRDLVQKNLEAYSNPQVQEILAVLGGASAPRDKTKVRELYHRYGTPELKELFDKVLDKAGDIPFEIKKIPTKLGNYSLTHHTIALDEKLLLDKNIDRFMQTLLHELIHATIARAQYHLLSPKNYPDLAHKLTPAQKAAVKEIDDLYILAFKNHQAQKRAKTLGDDEQSFYGLTNAKEFVAELANPKFRSYLEKQNIFKRVLEAIVKFFTGGAGEQTNILKALQESYEKYLDNFGQESGEFFIPTKASQAQKRDDLTLFDRDLDIDFNAPMREIKPQILAALKPIFNQTMHSADGKVQAYMSVKSLSKMTSDKAIQKSLDNGFSREEHLQAVLDIQRIFENAKLQATEPHKSGEKNAVIHRLNSELESGNALITTKESLDINKNRIYSIELELTPRFSDSSTPLNTKASVGGFNSQKGHQEQTIKAEPSIAKTDGESIAQDSNAILESAMKSFNYDEKKAKDLLEWHKDSSPLTKDENGLPKVFYHGTGNKVFDPITNKLVNFEVFSSRLSRQDDDFLKGHYFSSNIKIARTYNANIYKVFLNAKNPLVIDFKGHTFNDYIDDAIDSIPKHIQENIRDFYDSIIFKNIIDDNTQNGKKYPVADTIMVFEPNQIKHIENRGVESESGRKYFNDSSPNIFHSSPHAGAGLLGGSVAGIEQDESGNYTFDPAKFALGLLGGAAGSKAVSSGKYAIMRRMEAKKRDKRLYNVFKAIDSSAKYGSKMNLIGKENLNADTLAYALAKNKRFAINKLDEKVAKELGFKYPQDVRRSIEPSNIIHTLNRHGTESNLAKLSGQKPVTLDEIAKYQDYTDNAEYKGISKSKRQECVCVSASQLDNGFYVVVEQIRKGQNELGFKTMYFGKGRLDTEKFSKLLKT